MQTQTAMKTMLYKACPRCGGDLVLDNTGDTPEYCCLQCGRSRPAALVLEALRPAPPPAKLVA